MLVANGDIGSPRSGTLCYRVPASAIGPPSYTGSYGSPFPFMEYSCQLLYSHPGKNMEHGPRPHGRVCVHYVIGWEVHVKEQEGQTHMQVAKMVPKLDLGKRWGAENDDQTSKRAEMSVCWRRFFFFLKGLSFVSSGRAFIESSSLVSRSIILEQLQPDSPFCFRCYRFLFFFSARIYSWL